VKVSKSLFLAILTSFVLVGVMGSAHAQTKIRFVNSQRILDEYPAWKDVQKQVDELKKQYEDEFQKKQQEGQALLDEIQNQSLLLSPEKKAEKEGQLQNLQLQLEKFYYEKLGPQGEIFQKNQELSKPIFDKINTIIQKIGEEEGYDFILDNVQGVVLHAKAEWDVTDRVLEELNKAK